MNLDFSTPDLASLFINRFLLERGELEKKYLLSARELVRGFFVERVDSELESWIYKRLEEKVVDTIVSGVEVTVQTSGFGKGHRYYRLTKDSTNGKFLIKRIDRVCEFCGNKEYIAHREGCTHCSWTGFTQDLM